MVRNKRTWIWTDIIDGFEGAVSNKKLEMLPQKFLFDQLTTSIVLFSKHSWLCRSTLLVQSRDKLVGEQQLVLWVRIWCMDIAFHDTNHDNQMKWWCVFCVRLYAHDLMDERDGIVFLVSSLWLPAFQPSPKISCWISNNTLGYNQRHWTLQCPCGLWDPFCAFVWVGSGVGAHFFAYHRSGSVKVLPSPGLVTQHTNTHAIKHIFPQTAVPAVFVHVDFLSLLEWEGQHLSKQDPFVHHYFSLLLVCDSLFFAHL